MVLHIRPLHLRFKDLENIDKSILISKKDSAFILGYLALFGDNIEIDGIICLHDILE